MIREKVSLPADKIAPTAAEVLRQQGVPTLNRASDKALACAEKACQQCLHFMRPQGLLQEIPRAEGLALLSGQGVLHPEAPLPAIMARADHLALFAATLGEGISLRIRSLFTAGDYPLAAALDAAASLAADQAALVLNRTWAGHIAASGAAQQGSSIKPRRAGALAFLPYSPGYCGWDVTGQRALLAALQPAEVQLTLNESCVMEPLKSVSGIILGGPPEMHVFRPEFSFCTQCLDRTCEPRMASVLDSPTESPDHE